MSFEPSFPPTPARIAPGSFNGVLGADLGPKVTPVRSGGIRGKGEASRWENRGQGEGEESQETALDSDRTFCRLPSLPIPSG